MNNNNKYLKISNWFNSDIMVYILLNPRRKTACRIVFDTKELINEIESGKYKYRDVYHDGCMTGGGYLLPLQNAKSFSKVYKVIDNDLIIKYDIFNSSFNKEQLGNAIEKLVTKEIYNTESRIEDWEIQRLGIDFIIDGIKYQIKSDSLTYQTRNIFIEKYKSNRDILKL